MGATMEPDRTVLDDAASPITLIANWSPEPKK